MKTESKSKQHQIKIKWYDRDHTRIGLVTKDETFGCVFQFESRELAKLGYEIAREIEPGEFQTRTQYTQAVRSKLFAAGFVEGGGS